MFPCELFNQKLTILNTISQKYILKYVKHVVKIMCSTLLTELI